MTLKEEKAVTEMPLIVDLSSIDAATQSMTGGKASNLTKLTKAGFNVPSGFVVTTKAYSKFITSNQLESLASDHLSGISHEDAAKLSKATEAMRKNITGATLPEELVVSITSAYKQLGMGRVAIRSSATAEDLPDASFAGQYDTSLNIEGTENILEHIKNCFSSMWTNRAVAYREENKIPHNQVQIAVVVQSMVDVRCAGVLFTRNPISKLPDEMMIESNFGLGESVVSGYAIPDRYVVAENSVGGFSLVSSKKSAILT